MSGARFQDLAPGSPVLVDEVNSTGPNRSGEQPTVSLGGSVDLPLLGLGTWQMRGSECYRAVRHALDVGYRHIDTATMYRNERDVGRAVGDSGLARNEVVITTKLPPDRVGRERKTLGASLDALGTEYVDLWLIHWPPSGRAGVSTWREFIRLRDEGKVRAIGVSNYGLDQLDELFRASGVMPQVNQIPWGPSHYDPVEVEGLRARQVVLEGYSPFRSTDLRHPVLVEIATDHGVTPAQVVLRWHVDHRFVAIPKSARPERIETNFDVFHFSLTDEELRRIDGLSSRRR